MKQIIFLLLALSFLVHGQVMRLDQKEGVLQDRKDKQIVFKKIETINFSFDHVPLKRIRKIILHKNKLFILDSQRNQLYVINKKGKYLYSVGRPGNGPGEHEYVSDMFISDDDKIYVVNSLPNRIGVFDINGKPLDTIKLRPPTVWSYPKALLVNPGKGGRFIVGSTLNHLVSLYNEAGDYKKTILEPSRPREVEGTKIGTYPQLAFLNNNILHFDTFKGIFTCLNQAGELQMIFNGSSEMVNRKIMKLEEAVTRRNKKVGAMENETSFFILWSDFCIDEQNNIYVIPLSIKKEDGQKLFAFSPEGVFLYKKPLEYFRIKKMFIQTMCCDEQCFIFGTQNLDLIIAHRSK